MALVAVVPRYVVTKPNGRKRDETVVEGIQVVPIILNFSEYCSRNEEDEDNEEEEDDSQVNETNVECFVQVSQSLMQSF